VTPPDAALLDRFRRQCLVQPRRALLASAARLWRGGAVVELGLPTAIVAIELARRGARAVGIDPDPRRVEAAAELARALGVAITLEPLSLERVGHAIAERADVAVLEELPIDVDPGAAVDAALAAADAVVLPPRLRECLAERHRALAEENGPAGGALVLRASRGHEARVAGATAIPGPGAPSLGECSADASFERALRGRRAGDDAPRLVVVRDRGVDATGPDAWARAMTDPDRAGAIAAASTRTDRLSAEHVAALAPFDAVWVPGASVRRAAAQSGLDAARVRVVADAVDTEAFHPQPRAAGGLRALAMATSRARFDEVVSAAVAFAEELGVRSDARLTALCGPSVDPAELTAAVARALGGPPSPHRFEVVGPRPHADMPEWLASFDLFVRPSRGERRAVAILEAMACGVPVAATRFGLAGELVHLGVGYPIEVERLEACDPSREDVDADEAGHLRPVPSRASLREALRAAYDDAADRRARGARAREEVVARSSIAAVSLAAASELRVEIDAPASAPATPAGDGARTGDGVPSLRDAAKEIGPAVFHERHDLLAPLRAWMPAARAAREIWCTSPLEAQGWIAAGLEPRALVAAPPAVDLAAFHPRARKAVLPTRARFRVLADGRLSLTGGADLALRAFAAAQLPGAALVVCGASADARASLEKLAAASKRPPEVVFVAEPENAIARASLFAACDVAIDLSRGPSDGAWVLEAAACGRPSVAVEMAMPAGLVSATTGYPAPARLRLLAVGAEAVAGVPLACEAHVAETASVLRHAFDRAAARERRGRAARELALGFGADRRRAWIEERRRALASRETERAPSLAFVIPRGTVLPPIPSGAPAADVERVVCAGGAAARGGLAREAGDAIAASSCDLVAFATGSFEARGAWLESMIEPLRRDPETAASIARDASGALLVVRPALLRRAAFAEGFETPAFALECVRDAVRRGERVAPVSRVEIAFEPQDAAFAREVEAIEAMCAADAAREAQDAEAAIDALQRALAACPRYAAALDASADALESLGELEESLAPRRLLARLQPRDAGAHARLGAALARAGRLDEAASRLATARRISPEDPWIAHEHGRALAALGRHAGAADAYLAAVALAPESALAAHDAAFALEQWTGAAASAAAPSPSGEHDAAPSPSPEHAASPSLEPVAP